TATTQLALCCRTEPLAWHGWVPRSPPFKATDSSRPFRLGWVALRWVVSWPRRAAQNRSEAATASTFAVPETPAKLNCQAGSASVPRSVLNNPVPSLTPVTVSCPDTDGAADGAPDDGPDGAADWPGDWLPVGWPAVSAAGATRA